MIMPDSPSAEEQGSAYGGTRPGKARTLGSVYSPFTCRQANFLSETERHFLGLLLPAALGDFVVDARVRADTIFLTDENDKDSLFSIISVLSFVLSDPQSHRPLLAISLDQKQKTGFEMLAEPSHLRGVNGDQIVFVNWAQQSFSNSNQLRSEIQSALASPHVLELAGSR